MDFKNVKPFPKDFWWGASTSAFQFEGAYAEDGKGLSVADVKAIPEGTTDFKIASDHYHRYREDVALLAELGLKAYRFSIAWTRIFPNGNDPVPNEKGLQFYDHLINELIRHGIIPVVTLYHFDLPLALEKAYGGWRSRRIIDDFDRYCRTVFHHFGDRVKHWLTINEQNMMILYEVYLGDGRKRLPAKEKYDICHTMFLAQAKAVQSCHELVPGGKIGPAPNIVAVYPETSAPRDVLAAMDFDQLRNRLYLDVACLGAYPEALWQWFLDHQCAPAIEAGDMELLQNAKPDFIAFNYYGTTTVRYLPLDAEGPKFENEPEGPAKRRAFMTALSSAPGIAMGVKNQYVKETSLQMAIDPVGLHATLRQLWERYRLPLLITENGCGVPDTLENGKVNDDYRIEYLRAHIAECQVALHEGVRLLGYSPWSAMDLVSTYQGCTKRYGFVYVNRDEFDLKDLRRIKKKSFDWYRKVIATNGADLSNE
ncbi:6-phospho-beta-glucosidase [Hydrogenispora ethanolica]|uniref:6-phospho-beta-glucosidase n=1 Tax=Hydrogenispora ethanolica TaxID=1082276 RepID=A0A4R1QYI4_HYDET|nr:glycoside hydrolase family 1 protein [Hydrogenispora ethanolica]TCL57700.1 6-phospho-beta-glucosidase [Hydrogenispora ethanolica]